MVIQLLESYTLIKITNTVATSLNRSITMMANNLLSLLSEEEHALSQRKFEKSNMLAES